MLWVVSFFSPQLTIRRYMLVRLHPISAFTSNITNMERYDPYYGHLYNVTNYVDWSTGEEVSVFYLKKAGPFWMVGSVGTAP
jgi:hypothetical protein